MGGYILCDFSEIIWSLPALFNFCSPRILYSTHFWRIYITINKLCAPKTVKYLLSSHLHSAHTFTRVVKTSFDTFKPNTWINSTWLYAPGESVNPDFFLFIFFQRRHSNRASGHSAGNSNWTLRKRCVSQFAVNKLARLEWGRRHACLFSQLSCRVWLSKWLNAAPSSMLAAFWDAIFQFAVVYGVPCYFPTSCTFRIYDVCAQSWNSIGAKCS